MANWFTSRPLERSDRQVERCHVHARGQASRTRIRLSIEGALQFISLPGENQGRVYYFRHVRIPNLPVNAHRQQWTDTFQKTLHDLADHAILGHDPRAASANAIFFDNHQEALETLLTRTLVSPTAGEWFWPQVSGIASEASRAEMVLAIIERLREMEGSWVAVADSLFRINDSIDLLSLLKMLPISSVSGWLRGLTSNGIQFAHSRPIHLPETMKEILVGSAQVLGKTDPRVVWLATLIILRLVPSELTSGHVVARAQATLLALNSGGRGASCDLPSLASHENLRDVDIRWESQKGSSMPMLSSLRPESEAREGETADNIRVQRPVEDTNHYPIDGAIRGSEPAIRFVEARAGAGRRTKFGEIASPVLSGVPTEAAGLFFLLNALERLGIASALAACPAAADHGLVPRIMQRFAALARIERYDPVWDWINSSLAEAAPAETAELDKPGLFPSSLRPSLQKQLGIEYFARLWCVAIRRWCWHQARITVPEVVARKGLLSLNRTDLDITLPLNSVEIRIRRVGLDFDPGWLPWFGKVVRFHYVGNEVEHVH